MTDRTWFWDLQVFLFGIVGLYGWFFAIWIPEYRWRIFFTCTVSLILAMLINSMEDEE